MVKSSTVEKLEIDETEVAEKQTKLSQLALSAEISIRLSLLIIGEQGISSTRSSLEPMTSFADLDTRVEYDSVFSDWVYVQYDSKNNTATLGFYEPDSDTFAVQDVRSIIDLLLGVSKGFDIDAQLDAYESFVQTLKTNVSLLSISNT